MSGWKDFRERGPAPEAARLTILIVDDEPRILETLSELFGDHYRVRTAGDPETALAIFREERPQLVLCDQRMPGRTGIELLREFKNLEPGTIRMLITGYSDISVVIEAVNEEILHRYVTKPWQNEELLRTVAEGAKRYLEESGIAGGGTEILF